MPGRCVGFSESSRSRDRTGGRCAAEIRKRPTVPPAPMSDLRFAIGGRRSGPVLGPFPPERGVSQVDRLWRRPARGIHPFSQIAGRGVPDEFPLLHILQHCFGARRGEPRCPHMPLAPVPARTGRASIRKSPTRSSRSWGQAARRGSNPGERRRRKHRLPGPRTLRPIGAMPKQHGDDRIIRRPCTVLTRDREIPRGRFDRWYHITAARQLR